MKARYFFKVLGITIFSMFLLNSIGIAQIHYDSSGNVGIGTTTFGEIINEYERALLIKATPGNDAALVLQTDDNGIGALLFGKGTTNPSYKMGGISYHNEHDYMRIFTNDRERIRIDSSGYVGIGTVNPRAALHVNTGTNDNLIVRSDFGELQLLSRDDAYGANEPMYFEASRYYFKAGNVGIGTMSPAYKLDVAGDINMAGGTLSLRKGGYKLIGIENSETLGINYGGWNNVVVPNGNVGIGITTPSYKLHVNGTAYATGAAGALSDRRHKTNISDLSFDALEVVNNLHPVSFEWKEPQDSGMEGTQLGFIAQEVEEVLPEAVLTQDNEEQTKGLKYNALIPLLTKAIQELEAQNKVLKAENNGLRREIEQIKEAIGL